jgi:hypothetical protein
MLSQLSREKIKFNNMRRKYQSRDEVFLLFICSNSNRMLMLKTLNRALLVLMKMIWPSKLNKNKLQRKLLKMV